MTLTFCGCFVLQPAQYGGVKRRFLPQVEMHVHATVMDRVSHTVIKQKFENPAAKALKTIKYAFPLMPGVSVSSFKCTYGDNQVLVGTVKDKIVAKKEFDAEVEAGRKAGLMAQASETSDVFVIDIANVPGKSLVDVELAYIEQLPDEISQAAGTVRYTLPTKLAERYGQLPNELTPSPHWVKTKGVNRLSVIVDVCLGADNRITTLASPSHEIGTVIGQVSTDPQAEPAFCRASVSLYSPQCELGKDFVLYITAAKPAQSIAMIETCSTEERSRAAMLTLCPPPIETVTTVMSKRRRKEIFLVCDQSGSMYGDRNAKLIEAVRTILGCMNRPDIEFSLNVVPFGSHYGSFFEKSQTLTKEIYNEALKRVNRFDAGMGGTECLGPIEFVLNTCDREAETEVIFLSDGDVYGEALITQKLTEHMLSRPDQLRVSTIAIGNDASHGALQNLARVGNGLHQVAAGSSEHLLVQMARMFGACLLPQVPGPAISIVCASGRTVEMNDAIGTMAGSGTAAGRPGLSFFPDDFKSIQNRDGRATAVVAPAVEASITDKDAARFPVPVAIQSPANAGSLPAVQRTNFFFLLGPDLAGEEPVSFAVRYPASHPAAAVFNVDVPIQPVGGLIQTQALQDRNRDLIHQLAARSFATDHQTSKDWLARIETVGDKADYLSKCQHFAAVRSHELIRMGVNFGIVNSACSFIAVQAPTATPAPAPDTFMEEADWVVIDQAERKHGKEDAHDPDNYGADSFELVLCGGSPDSGSTRGMYSRSAGLGVFRSAASRSAVSRSAVSRGMAFGGASRGGDSSDDDDDGSRGALFACAAAAPSGGALFGMPVGTSRGMTKGGSAFASRSFGGGAESCLAPAPAPTLSAPATEGAFFDRLNAARDFEGYWPDGGDAELAALVGYTDLAAKRAAVVAACAKLGFTVDKPHTATTILVLTYLQAHKADRADIWGLLVSQTYAWLDSQGVDSAGLRAGLAGLAKAVWSA